MRNFAKLVPWRPEVTFTGSSVYKVDTDTGKILSQVDTWDSVDNQKFPSVRQHPRGRTNCMGSHELGGYLVVAHPPFDSKGIGVP